MSNVKVNIKPNELTWTLTLEQRVRCYKQIFKQFQPSVAFHLKTSHLIAALS